LDRAILRNDKYQTKQLSNSFFDASQINGEEAIEKIVPRQLAVDERQRQAITCIVRPPYHLAAACDDSAHHHFRIISAFG
jgi:hypothetical protein